MIRVAFHHLLSTPAAQTPDSLALTYSKTSHVCGGVATYPRRGPPSWETGEPTARLPSREIP